MVNSWGEMLRIFRKDAGLSGDGLADALSFLELNLQKAGKEDQITGLKAIGADTYVALNKSTISRLENNHDKFPLKRSEQLAYIYFFSQITPKGKINLDQADAWLKSGNQRSIDNEECKVLFGYELEEHEVGKREIESNAAEASRNRSFVRHNFDHAKAYVDRGIARYWLGKLDEAIADYNKAIEIAPSYAKAYVDRGIARYRQGRLDEAIADYNKAIEIEPDYAQAYVDRGIARYRQGRLNEAIVDYNKAIALDPYSANVYFDRGIAKAKQGMLNEAIADYQHYLQLDTSGEDRLPAELWISQLQAESAK